MYIHIQIYIYIYANNIDEYIYIYIYTYICIDMIGSPVKYDSFICGNCLIHMWEMTHLYVRCQSNFIPRYQGAVQGGEDS